MEMPATEHMRFYFFKEVDAMNLLLKLLTESLNRIFNEEAEITKREPETLLSYANPSGGKPVQIVYRPSEDIKVTLNKTARYYQQDTASIEQLQKDIASYAEGKTVSIDYTDHNGNESKIDRLAKAADAETLTLSSLIDLSIRISLLHSDELKDLLASGGTVNVHFWNRANNFRYRQIGDRLEKI